MSDAEQFDAVVVGGGISGAVCAASLAIRGVRPLLIAETARLGHNVRSVELDGCLGNVQQAAWHFGWGGGNWARVIREQNLPTAVHISPPVQGTLRGMGQRARLPVMMSASSVCELLFKMLPIQLEGEERKGLERVLHAGLMIPYTELCDLHDTPIGQWLEEQQASDTARLVIELLAAVVAGLPLSEVTSKFSVFGVFAHIRTYFGGDGYFTVIEPDIQRGFVEPLGRRVEELGGTVWKGTHVERVDISAGAVTGVRMADGRVAQAPIVALATGNPRLERFFDQLPPELEAPLAKEREFQHKQVMIATLLEEPVYDTTDILFVHDPVTGDNVWLIPLHAIAPWHDTDGRHFVLQWWGGGGEDRDPAEVEEYLDELCEEQFPGWKKAVGPRAHIVRRHHWLNPCYVGPKVPRVSPSVRGLRFVGESTAPVGGIASDQAAFAGYSGALSIGEELGKTTLLSPPGLTG